MLTCLCRYLQSLSSIVDIAAPPVMEKRGNKPLFHLYREGILKVECLVLQCVGFNHALYNQLLQSYQPNIGSKRKHEKGDAPPEKKAKA